MVTKRPTLPPEGKQKSKARKGAALSTAQLSARHKRQKATYLKVLEGGKGKQADDDTPKRKRPVIPGAKPAPGARVKAETGVYPGANRSTVRGGLTAKQEAFCRAVIRGETQADAYREAYNAEGMSNHTIHTEASILMTNPKVAKRVKEGLEAKEVRERHDASRIRAHIEERLWIESKSAETAAARLKAVELLGKLDHVGAFKERTELETTDNREPEEIEDRLSRRLAELSEEAG